ncbi:hypothetical protein GA0115235_11091, partial [Streptomyces sp. DpondAA-F4a]
MPGGAPASESAAAHSAATVSAYKRSRGFLGDEADAAHHLAGSGTERVQAADEDGARGRLQHPDERAQQGRLARAVAAHQ